MDPLGHCEAAAAAFPRNRILLPIELAVAKFQHLEKGAAGVDSSVQGVLSTPAITIYVMGPVQANLTLNAHGRVRAVPMRASALPASAANPSGADLTPWKGDSAAADDELGNYWASFDNWCVRMGQGSTSRCRPHSLLLAPGPRSRPSPSTSKATAPWRTRPPAPAGSCSAARPARPATCSTRPTLRLRWVETTSSGRAAPGTRAPSRRGRMW